MEHHHFLWVNQLIISMAISLFFVRIYIYTYIYIYGGFLTHHPQTTQVMYDHNLEVKQPWWLGDPPWLKNPPFDARIGEELCLMVVAYIIVFGSYHQKWDAHRHKVGINIVFDFEMMRKDG